MKKNHQYILGVVIAILVLIVVFTIYSLVSSPTRKAFLNVLEGSVELDSGNGYKQVVGSVKLKLSDKVKTLNGKAAIVLYESLIVTLDPNTEVSLAQLSKEHIELKQNSGSTWNKLTNIAGITNYVVRTPTTVATVRGTEFGVDMEVIRVAEGKVIVESDGKEVEITAGRKTTRQSDGSLLVEELSSDELAKIRGKLGESLNILKDIREDEIQKHPTAYKIVKSSYDLTETDVEQYLKDIDAGEVDDRKLAEASPIPIKSIDKMLALNDQIKKQQEAIETLS